MKKGLLKALGITALVAVSAVGGLALGAEISNGFETTYSESAYEDYGDKQHQAGFEAGKEEGLQEGFENGQQAGHEAGYQEGQQAGYENGYTAGEQAGYEAGLAEGYTEEDIQNAIEETEQELSELIDFLASGTRLSYKSNEYDFLTSTGGIEGVFLHNKSTDNYQKIITKGDSFDFRCYDNTHLLISGKNETCGGYIFNLLNGNFVQFADEGQWEIMSLNSEGSNDFLCYSTPAPYDDTMRGEGVYFFNGDTLEYNKILNGKYWSSPSRYTNDDDQVVLYFTSSSEDELGLYEFNIVTKELITIASEGYAYLYSFYDIGNKQVTTCSLGVVEILPDTTVNVLISANGNEHFEIYGDMAYSSNRLFRYNHDTEVYDYINPNIEVLSFYQKPGVFYVFNNNENKFVIYSVETNQIYSADTSINIEIANITNYEFNTETNYVIVDSFDGNIYKIDFDKNTCDIVEDI